MINKYPNVIFRYIDHDMKAHDVKMLRAAPEWVNHEFPTLYAHSDNSDWNGFRINSGLVGGAQGGGWVIESVPEWMRDRFIRWFKMSTDAYYYKYEPQAQNHMWDMFLADLWTYQNLSPKDVLGILKRGEE